MLISLKSTTKSQRISKTMIRKILLIILISICFSHAKAVKVTRIGNNYAPTDNRQAEYVVITAKDAEEIKVLKLKYDILLNALKDIKRNQYQINIGASTDKAIYAEVEYHL